MTDEPENHTLRLLREIRSETREGFTKVFDDLAELREQTGLIPQLVKDVSELQSSVSELQHEVGAMRVDQGRTNELLEKVHKTQQNHGARPNAIDGRLAIIEENMELVKA